LPAEPRPCSLCGVFAGEWPHLADSGHQPTNATLRPVPRGIDCPEKGQAYGNNAKHAASALAFGKEVNVQTHGHNKYKRTTADVLLADGTNVNHELVKEG
jgi:hypothetical protein